MKVLSLTVVTSMALLLLPTANSQPTQQQQQQTFLSPQASANQPPNGLDLHGNFLHITDMHVSQPFNVGGVFDG
jgi:hypothetical protein